MKYLFPRYALILVVLLSFCLTQADQTKADLAELVSFGLEKISEKNVLPRNWRLRVHAGTADLGVVSEGGEHVLHMKCKESSFSIERKAYVDSAEYSYIIWTWKALKIPAHGDVRVRDRNEQPPHITGIRIQTNTQYTKDSAEGMIKGIIFRKALSAAAMP